MPSMSLPRLFVVGVVFVAIVSLASVHARRGSDESASNRKVEQVQPASASKAGVATGCSPEQKKSECVKEMYAALEPRLMEYEACDKSTKQKLNEVEDLKAVMEAAAQDGSVNVPNLKAQIRNLIAQNTKLVAELGKYQGFSSENEKMQRTIRKTSTELDLLKNQVEVLGRKVKDEKKKHVEMEKEERMKTEKCEEEIGILKDAFWSNQLKIPENAK